MKTMRGSFWVGSELKAHVFDIKAEIQQDASWKEWTLCVSGRIFPTAGTPAAFSDIRDLFTSGSNVSLLLVVDGEPRRIDGVQLVYLWADPQDVTKCIDVQAKAPWRWR